MPAALKDLPPLILASASPRRAELLRQLSLDFKVVPGGVPEIHHDQLTAREVSQINAYRKARCVAKKFPDLLVLGADTLVCLGNVLFGKPATLEAAYQMLEQLQGRTHQVVTGICLLHLRNHRQSVFAESTAAIFPLILSGNSAIALALKLVTGCFSTSCLKSLVIANPTLMPSAWKGYLESAV